MDGEPNQRSKMPSGLIGQIRIAIGLGQGLCAWALLRVSEHTSTFDAHTRSWQPGAKHWAQYHPMIFAALTLIVAYVPLLALAEIGRMRRRTLLLWLGGAAVLLAALAAFDIWRVPVTTDYMSLEEVRIWPSLGLSFRAAVMVFIANQLLEHREQGHRLFTHYPQHFEDSWMRGFQLAMALAFTGIFWGVLWLGAGLFDLIKLHFMIDLLGDNWFRCPALAMAFAAAVHVTDVRPAMIRGLRNVALTLLSWLLPLMVVLVGGFLCAILFTGLKPLWDTRHAATLLLSTAAVLIGFVNAAYQDGEAGNVRPMAIRYAALATGPLLIVLVGLATYAVSLRIGQHGLTPDRVLSVAASVVGFVYAVGYSYAGIARNGWMKPLERVNVAASIVILGILIAVNSPIADPMRLSVNDQLTRLRTGRTQASAFDYQFLRFDGGTYGTSALTTLTRDSNADVKARAMRALAAKDRYTFNVRPNPAATEAPFSRATIFPAGAKLPESFRRQDWSVDASENIKCMNDGAACDIYLYDYEHNGKLDVLVLGGDPVNGILWLELFQPTANGGWERVGNFNDATCAGLKAAFISGDIHAVRPLHDDLLIGGVRLELFTQHNGSCPKPPPAPIKPIKSDPVAPSHMGPAFGHPGGL